MVEGLAASDVLGFLAGAIDSIEQGVLVIDASERLVFANTGYRRLFDLDEAACRQGRPITEVFDAIAASGEFGLPESGGTVVGQRMLSLRERQSVKRVRVRPNGQVLSISGTPLANGGYIYTFLDVTREHKGAEQLRRAYKAAVIALADLAEFRDTDTGDHVLRVARLTHEIARAMIRDEVAPDIVTEEFCNHIGIASILHDVGKVVVPDDILRKAGPLDAVERRVMQEHAQAGGAILEKAATMAAESLYLQMGQAITLHHHERYDGTGYPRGIGGEDIPLEARIVAAADVFDALTNSRPYKKAWPLDEAIAHIRSEAGRHFDPVVVEAFLQVMEERMLTPVIEWTDAMSVGVPTLDRDHKILIGLINQLALKSNRDDRATIEIVLDELVGYTIAHFSREEAHLRRIGFPEAPRHHHIHARLAEQLRDIHKRYLDGGQGVGDEVLDFLGRWLRNHILEEDMRYNGYSLSADQSR